MNRTLTKRRPTLRYAALGSVLMLAVVAACSSPGSTEDSSGSAGGCSLKVAVADDDVRRAALYAIENDKIDTSSVPNLEISHLKFPALIQSVGKTQYDLVESSLTGVAVARSQGVDLRILALSAAYPGGGGLLSWYVAADSSDITSPEDLKGKTFGVTSLGSTATTVTRIILADKFGFNAELTGGDVTFVQLPATQLMSSLERGQIDVADMYGNVAYQASQNPRVRELSQTDVLWKEVTGHPLIGAAYQMLQSQYESKPDCYLAFRELLDESVQYAREHIEGFAAEVAEKTGRSADFVISQWQGDSFDYVASVDPDWVEAAQSTWDQAKKLGTISSAPDIEPVIVK